MPGLRRAGASSPGRRCRRRGSLAGSGALPCWSVCSSSVVGLSCWYLGASLGKMIAMTKRLLLKLGLVALLGAGLFVAWLWWMEPKTGICRYSASQIQNGMTEKEVIAAIGNSPGDYRKKWDYWSNLNYDNQTKLPFLRQSLPATTEQY